MRVFQGRVPVYIPGSCAISVQFGNPHAGHLPVSRDKSCRDKQRIIGQRKSGLTRNSCWTPVRINRPGTKRAQFCQASARQTTDVRERASKVEIRAAEDQVPKLVCNLLDYLWIPSRISRTRAAGGKLGEFISTLTPNRGEPPC